MTENWQDPRRNSLRAMSRKFSTSLSIGSGCVAEQSTPKACPSSHPARCRACATLGYQTTLLGIDFSSRFEPKTAGALLAPSSSIHPVHELPLPKDIRAHSAPVETSLALDKVLEEPRCTHLPSACPLRSWTKCPSSLPPGRGRGRTARLRTTAGIAQ